jgi:hypothetical protein
MHTLLNATKQHSLSELVHVKKHHTQSISVSSTNTEPKVEYKINARNMSTHSERGLSSGVGTDNLHIGHENCLL